MRKQGEAGETHRCKNTLPPLHQQSLRENMTNPSIPLRLLVLSLLLSVLPVLRAQTDPYTAYIERYKTLAVQQMYKYGIPASITLSQGLLESGAGKSLLAAKANNHFGIKAGPSWTGPVMLKDDDAVGEKFRVYPNVLASYEDHSLFLSRGRRYASLFTLERDDYKGWAHGLKSAGYATNPRYAHLLIGLIERYGLHRYDHFSRHAASALVTNTSSAVPSALVSTSAAERRVYRCNKRFYVVALPGDTYASIGKWAGKSERRLRRYNEVPRRAALSPGDVVFLEKKRKKAARVLKHTYHTVRPGDSLHAISQRYGMRVETIYKNNGIPLGGPIAVGQKLRIR